MLTAPPKEASSIIGELTKRRGGWQVPCNPQTGANTPLLLLYPIDKDSESTGQGGNRTALRAVDHVVGLTLVFPAARRLTPQSYLTADLTRINEPREELDYTAETEAT